MNKILKIGMGVAATVAGSWTLVNAFMGKRPVISTQATGVVTETFETVQDAVESVTEAVTE